MRHLFLVSFCSSPVWLRGAVPPWQRLAECWDWERKPGHCGWNTGSAEPEWASMSLLDAALQALVPWKPQCHNHRRVKADEYHNVLSMLKRVTRLSHLWYYRHATSSINAPENGKAILQMCTGMNYQDVVNKCVNENLHSTYLLISISIISDEHPVFVNRYQG